MVDTIEWQDKTSWVSTICGACAIILLGVYILWVPDNKDAPALIEEKKTEIQLEKPETLNR